MTRIGQYEIQCRIGVGGMGTVYKARDPRFDRPVAIKVLHPQFHVEPGIVDRFKTEAVIQAKLQHPNIVSVFDFIADDATLAIVMEFVEGRPLDRVIEDAGAPLEPGWAIAVMVQVLSALDLAHQQGLVHRDLKPSNILVRDLRGEPLTKVTDFGIARVLGAGKQVTATGARMGTLTYMPPEQIRNPRLADARSDLYALGATLYEMLTGRVPFDGDSEFDVSSQIVAGAVAPPRTIVPTLARALEAVVLRAMATDPSKRFADADQMRQALRVAASEPGARALPGVGVQLLVDAAAVPPPPTGPAAPVASTSRLSAPEAALNATGMQFVRIAPGQFEMGAAPVRGQVGPGEFGGVLARLVIAPSDSAPYPDEHPVHPVRITRWIEIGTCPVTQAQWEAVMKANPSRFRGGDSPVETISWRDAQEFIARLNAGRDGYHYRLPTEAEWEYAARAGTTGPRYGPLDEVAWYDGNSGGSTHPVGQKEPNAWGLYDTLGNVWEWCQDYYGPYPADAAVDPTGPASGRDRVLRGGSWYSVTRSTRASFRYCVDPGNRSIYSGVRLVREVVP